jgi:curved DNA-binding protein CbpA
MRPLRQKEIVLELLVLNPYETLGVDKDATMSTIKAQYRKLAKLYHPDAGGDPEEFQRLAMAYSVLTDPEWREQYDITGTVDRGAVMNEFAQMVQILANIIGEILEKDPVALEQKDAILIVKNTARHGVEAETVRSGEITQKIRAMERFRKRVVRNDHEENIFAKIADDKIKLLHKQRLDAERNRKIASRMLEELENYSTPVEMARTMQGFVFTNQAFYATGTSSTSTTVY